MTQDKRISDNRRSKDPVNTSKKTDCATGHVSNASSGDIPSKVVVRRLPPFLTAEKFLEQISPVPDYNHFCFVEPELELGQNGFSRAYINFVNTKDIYIFQEKFDGYIFLDDKGNEYPAVVEFAPFPRIPKKKNRKPDSRKGTIESDPDYMKFLEKLNNTETEPIPLPETLLEEIEAKEKLLKANHGCPKVTTPLIEYLSKKKDDKRPAFMSFSGQHARDEKRRKELDKRKQRDEERRRRFEREKELREAAARQKQKEREEREQAKEVVSAPVKLLKNPEREKERVEDRERVQSSMATEPGRLKEEEQGGHEAGANRHFKASWDDQSREKDMRRRGNRPDKENTKLDERRDGKDKGRRGGDKLYGERERRRDSDRKEDDRRRDSESSATSNYGGSRKRTDHYEDQGNRETERDRYKEAKYSDKDRYKAERDRYKDRAKEVDNEKVPEGSDGRNYSSRGQERDTARGQEKDSNRSQNRDSAQGQEKDSTRPKERDGRKDTKTDQGRQKEVDRKGQSRDSKYPKTGYSDRGERSDRGYGDRRASGAKRYPTDSHDVPKDQAHGNRTTGSSEGRKETVSDQGPCVGDKPAQRGKTPEDKGTSGGDRGEKEMTPQSDDNHQIRRGSCDSTGSSTGDVNRNKSSAKDEDLGPSARNRASEDAEEGGKGNSEKSSSSASSRQKVRYKDRPERAIYNPARRAVERQKESSSSSR